MTRPTTDLEITTAGDLEIVISRTFAASRNLVFEAWTNCEHLKRWWGPRTWDLVECDIDLRVGGKWRFFMRSQNAAAGFRQNGDEMGMYGEYRVIERPGRLVQTEHFDGALFEPMGGGSLNTMILEEVDANTTKMISTALYKSKEARDSVMQIPMEEGLEESLGRLDELLESLQRDSQR